MHVCDAKASVTRYYAAWKSKSGSLTTIFWAAEQGHPILALHYGGDAIAQELGLGFEFPEDVDVVRGGGVEEGGYWWVMGDCST